MNNSKRNLNLCLPIQSFEDILIKQGWICIARLQSQALSHHTQLSESTAVTPANSLSHSPTQCSTGILLAKTPFHGLVHLCTKSLLCIKQHQGHGPSSQCHSHSEEILALHNLPMPWCCLLLYPLMHRTECQLKFWNSVMLSLCVTVLSGFDYLMSAQFT